MIYTAKYNKHSCWLKGREEVGRGEKWSKWVIQKGREPVEVTNMAGYTTSWQEARIGRDRQRRNQGMNLKDGPLDCASKTIKHL